MNKDKQLNVVFLSEFDKELERFVRKKKFKKLPAQVDELEKQLQDGKIPGKFIRRAEEPEPYEVYKLRLPNPDANAGKSDGYRIYYLVVTAWRIIVLMTVYYKKEQETVSDAYIDGLIDGFFFDAMPYEETDEQNLDN